MKLHRLFAVAAAATIAVSCLAQGDPNGGGPGGGGTPPGQGGPGGPGGMMRPGLQPVEMLLRRSDVQTELALTDDQKTKLEDLFDSMRGQFGGPGGGGPGGGGPGGGGPGGPPDGGGGPPPDGGQGGPPPGGGQGGSPPDGGGPGGGGPGGGGPGGGGPGGANFEAMRKKISDAVNAILTDTQKKRVKELQIQLAGNAAAVDAGVQKALKLTDDQKAKIAALVKQQSAANRSVFENMRSGLIEMDQARASLTKNQKTLSVEIGKVLTADQATALTALGGKVFKPDTDSSDHL